MEEVSSDFRTLFEVESMMEDSREMMTEIS